MTGGSAAWGTCTLAELVDDDELVRSLLAEFFQNEGYAVDSAEGAEEAIRLLLRNRYSLLVTDLEMPETSGVELIQEVRARGLRLPILAVSATSEAMRDAAVLNIGVAEHLSKPFTIGELKVALVRLLARTEKEDSDTPRPQRYSRE